MECVTFRLPLHQSFKYKLYQISRSLPTSDLQPFTNEDVPPAVLELVPDSSTLDFLPPVSGFLDGFPSITV